MIKALLGALLLIPSAVADDAFTLRGTVKVDGPVPPAKPNKDILRDPACAKLHPDAPPKDDLVVAADGGVKWAFVWIKAGLPAKEHAVPAAPVLLTQSGCTYEPHVFGIMPGQALEVVNGDELMHNVHILPLSGNKELNRGQPVKGSRDTYKFVIPELPPVLVKCDIHPSMKAWACVVDHPYYAVTDAAGNFEIKGLPAGKYTVGVWHESLKTVGGKNEAEVEVKADGRINFVMARKS